VTGNCTRNGRVAEEILRAFCFILTYSICKIVNLAQIVNFQLESRNIVFGPLGFS
jgi:hypothetical protein